MEENSWKVIYVGARQEKKVAKKLSELGIENYLPLAKRLSQWSDRKKWVEFPMFNGYLFVRPTPKEREIVLHQHGVINYLRFEQADAIVKKHEIEIIQIIEKEGYYAETIFTSDDFEVGDKVLVTEGPLKGQVVDLLRKNNEKMFLIAFDSIGQSIKLNIPMEFLARS
ncbi:MAG: UpxY family transcription antiterminator [Flavobacteriales bacterium]|nr:UpxY family transcription antiterminator [Flavobacteriales bacterium]